MNARKSPTFKGRFTFGLLMMLMAGAVVAQPVSVTSITFTYPEGINFNRLQGVRLNLSGPAPAGTVAKVTDDSPYISFPGNVPVPEGATFVDFVVYSGGDQFFTGIGAYPVNVVAWIGSTPPATNSFQMYPQQSWFFFTPPNVYGGDRFEGLVGSSFNWLTDTIVIGFGDDSPLVSSPRRAVVWWDFPIENPPVSVLYHTYQVAQATTVRLRASSDGFHQDRFVTLHPRPMLTSVLITPASVTAGSRATGRIQMSFPGHGGPIPVDLASNSPFATVPGSVTVPMDSDSVTFDIATLPVSTTQIVAIRARYHNVIRSGRFSITP